MSWFDAGALVVIALAVVDGARSGLAWAALESVVLVAAALLAGLIRPHAEPYVLKVAALTPEDLPWVAHLVVFVACACSLFGVLLLLQPTVKKWRVRHDRIAGSWFGLLNGVLASVIAFAMLLGASGPSIEAEARTSTLLPAVRAAAASPLAPLLPDHAARRARVLAGE